MKTAMNTTTIVAVVRGRALLQSRLSGLVSASGTHEGGAQITGRSDRRSIWFTGRAGPASG